MATGLHLPRSDKPSVLGNIISKEIFPEVASSCLLMGWPSPKSPSRVLQSLGLLCKVLWWQKFKQRLDFCQPQCSWPVNVPVRGVSSTMTLVIRRWTLAQGTNKENPLSDGSKTEKEARGSNKATWCCPKERPKCNYDLHVRFPNRDAHFKCSISSYQWKAHWWMYAFKAFDCQKEWVCQGCRLHGRSFNKHVALKLRLNFFDSVFFPTVLFMGAGNTPCLSTPLPN